MTSRPTLLSAALLLLAVYLGTASAGKDDASAPFMKKIDLGKFDAENPFSDVMLEINPADDVSARALAGIEKTDEEEADILNEMAYRRERMLINFTAKVTRKGESKKCKCKASNISKCRRCLGSCCHDIKNGTKECRHYATNTCRKLWGKPSKGKYKKKKKKRV